MKLAYNLFSASSTEVLLEFETLIVFTKLDDYLPQLWWKFTISSSCSIITCFCSYQHNLVKIKVYSFLHLSGCHLCCLQTMTVFSPLCPACITNMSEVNVIPYSWIRLFCWAVTFSPWGSRVYGKRCMLKAWKNSNIPSISKPMAWTTQHTTEKGSIIMCYRCDFSNRFSYFRNKTWMFCLTSALCTCSVFLDSLHCLLDKVSFV